MPISDKGIQWDSEPIKPTEVKWDAPAPEASTNPIMQALELSKQLAEKVIPSAVKVPGEAVAGGVYGMGSQAAAGVGSLYSSAVKSGGDAIAGKSFADRFTEDYEKAAGKFDALWHPTTPGAQKMLEGVSKVFDTIVQGAANTMGSMSHLYYHDLMGIKDTTQIEAASAAYGAGASALALLVGGGKATPEAKSPIKSFAEKYPETMKRIEASQVGDAPVGEAMRTQPAANFSSIIHDALNKELGIQGDKELPIGDKIKLVVQKHAAASGENIPLADQIQYASDLSNKVAELQKHMDSIVSIPAGKLRVRPKTPSEMTAQAQVRALSNLAAEKGYANIDEFIAKDPVEFNTFATNWRQLQEAKGKVGDVKLDPATEADINKTAMQSVVAKEGAKVGDYLKNDAAFESVARQPLAGQVGLEDIAKYYGTGIEKRKGERASKSLLTGQAFGQRGAIGNLYAPTLNDALAIAAKREGEVGKKTDKGWQVSVPMSYEDVMKLPEADRVNTTRVPELPTKIDTNTLLGFRDIDRNVFPKSAERSASITRSIQQQGIQKPVTITVSVPDKLAYITDGNTRTTIAGNLGLPDVPVKFEKTNVPFTESQKLKARPVSELGITTDMIPEKVRTTQQAADYEELKRLLSTDAFKGQRGILNIEGVEKNTEAAKKALLKATGEGWLVQNPDASAKYVKEVMAGNRDAVEKSQKAFGDNVAKKARRAIYAHDYDLRADLKNAGPAGEVAHARMVVQNGATMAAKTQMDKVNRAIFDKYSHEDRSTLDEITRLRRIIQIDKYKGIGSVRHEGGITGPMALARLDQIKTEIGLERYNDLNNSSTSIFEQQRLLLDKLRDNGLIDDKLHGKLYNLDYTRTQYLDEVDPAIPIASHVKNMPTQIRSSGIPELGHGKTTAAFMDSQALLTEDVARVENRIFKNRTLQAIRQLAIENPENGIVRIPTEQAVKTLATGDKMVRQTPEGWTTIGVRVGGKQDFIQMRDEYAEQFVNRPEAMPTWLANTFRVVSGTSLIKTTSTGMNPPFVIAGIPMDTFHTWVTTTDVYSPHLPLYLAQMGKDMAATAKDAFTKSGTWEDAMREGIGSSYLTHESRGLSDPGKSIKAQMTPHFEKIRSTLSYLNDVSDMWIRLAYRKRLIDNGMEPWMASATSRNRLDYFQGGMVAKAFDTIFPYTNVTIQATGKALEAAKRDPMGAMIKSAWIVSTAASVKLASMISSPETDKNISTMDKVRNFNITFGDQYYTLDANGNKRYMYIPIRLDQVIMPFNAAVIGGLELAEYGKAPNGITTSAIGQVSPISSAFPIPTIDSVATYVTNYDEFTGRPVYQGPKVLPQDEIRSFSSGKPTGQVAQLAGQATGMSPMRLEAAASKLVNTNNFYIQAMGGAYKLLFEGTDPREQASMGITMLQNVPGLRNIVKLTTPGSGMIEDLQQAEMAAGSKSAAQLRGLNDLIFQQEHGQNNVNMKTIETYINNQPAEVRQKLADHVKYTVTVDKIMEHYKASDNIPPRAWWIASAKAPGDVRAQAFYDRWVSASSEDRQRMLGIANSLQNNGIGYLSPDFQKAFAAERQLLGDDRR